ncbi:MAG: transglutaminase-like cysteine peptidase [Deltaproteobacteria bacterium]|jgi:predicted transglutaminase-like cysteine proteinase|nr:transglutaminase-like cysteine peptidase [Deltaproteobacteria bacterium]
MPGVRHFLPQARVVVHLCLIVLAFWIAAAGIAVGAEPIKLFGTVEIKRPLDSPPDWLDAMERNAKNPIFKPEQKLNSSTTWGELKARLEPLPPAEQLKQVNSFWNRWPYRTDMEAYGKEDYWAVPYEFIKHSGDCEDFSIAKFFTLRELGFPPESVRIVIVMETIRNIAHAILVVYLDGDAYILDNLSSNVLSHSRYRNYEPRYSVNEQHRWAHMKPKK